MSDMGEDNSLEEDIGLRHRLFRDDPFWTDIPSWSRVERGTFADHKWQLKNSISRITELPKLLGQRIPKKELDVLMKDIAEGQKITPMNIRITPYIFSLINWEDPYNDPLRKTVSSLGKPVFYRIIRKPCPTPCTKTWTRRFPC